MDIFLTGLWEPTALIHFTILNLLTLGVIFVYNGYLMMMSGFAVVPALSRVLREEENEVSKIRCR